MVIKSGADVPGRNIEELHAILVPPPGNGFLTISKHDFFAIAPVLRCRWKRDPHPDVPWVVQFPIDEEASSGTRLSDMRVLHRPDQPQAQWQELGTEIRSLTVQGVVEFNVLHFSDILLVIDKATVSERRDGHLRRRRPMFSPRWFSSEVRQLSSFSVPCLPSLG